MPKRALIVDDASYMRELIKDALARAGYEIAGEAENGADAVVKYKKLKPDLVTMDIVMQEKSGVDAVRDIVKFDKSARVLIVSAMGQQSMIIEAIQAGAKGFIIKPFKADVLMEEVRRIVG
jgi:two-component system chemotaxis response regulator CheY